MSNRAELAEIAFQDGYNCCQAVAVAFSDRMGLQKDQAARMASGFGGGMGRLREVCGAVSGMVFVASMLEGYSDPKDNDGKKALYARIQALAENFRQENHAIVCRELLNLPAGKDSPTPAPRTETYYKKRPCGELVRSAAAFLEKEFPEE